MNNLNVNCILTKNLHFDFQSMVRKKNWKITHRIIIIIFSISIFIDVHTIIAHKTKSIELPLFSCWFPTEFYTHCQHWYFRVQLNLKFEQFKKMMCFGYKEFLVKCLPFWEFCYNLTTLYIESSTKLSSIKMDEYRKTFYVYHILVSSFSI